MKVHPLPVFYKTIVVFYCISYQTVFPILLLHPNYLDCKIQGDPLQFLLRCSASFLNTDLYKVNVVNSPACACGVPYEDVFHFFFVCGRYINYRRELLHNLEWLPQNTNVNVKFLTQGNDRLTFDENILIIRHVFSFIRSTKRF